MSFLEQYQIKKSDILPDVKTFTPSKFPDYRGTM